MPYSTLMISHDMTQIHKQNMGLKSLKSCSMPIVPIDILVSEILPRLPARTLLHFKCVNKFFHNYISSKEFIDLHLQRSSNSNINHLLIVFTAKRAGQRCVYLLDVDSPGSPALYLSLPEPFCDMKRNLKVVGSCNGLLCLNSHLLGNKPVYNAMIVNPTTGNVIANTSLSIPPWSRTCSGFAYDGVNDDYKLVVVKYFGEFRGHRTYRYRKVMVYSMRSDSWRLAETTYFGYAFTKSDYRLCIPCTHVTCVLMSNYLMHWLLTAWAGNMSIVCFNLGNEQWTADVPLPDSKDFECGSHSSVKLGMLNGCLCLSALNHIDKFDVWIMKEYREPGSWTKLSIAVPNYRGYYPIFAYEHAAMEEILVTESRPYRLGIQTYIWYNIRDKTAKKLQFIGAPNDLEDHLLCIGTLTGSGNCQSQNCKDTKVMMKIDSQVKALQANVEQLI